MTRPGFEIFASDTWSYSEDEAENLPLLGNVTPGTAQLDWIHSFDEGCIGKLFLEDDQEEDMEIMMLACMDGDEDPTKLIVKANGAYKNCVFAPAVAYDVDESESSESESDESLFDSESELAPVSPPLYRTYFEFESVLNYPEGSSDEMNASTLLTLMISL